MNNEAIYFAALKRIASYESTEKLARNAMRDYGLEFHDALEMAYENVIEEAKRAVKGKRLPVIKE